jgi:very-short-patch-repair endonuclease
LVAKGKPKLALAAIAAKQRGLVSRAQLELIGFTPRAIRTTLRDGYLQRVRRGVYRVGPELEVKFRTETAALLSVGEDALLVGAAVLTVLGAIKPNPKRPIDVALEDARYASPREGIRVHRYSKLPSTEIKTREGLRMTTVERALLDSVPYLSAQELAMAFDEALAKRLTSRTKIIELLARTQGRPEAATLKDLLDPQRKSQRTESPAEEEALKLIAEAGLPTPETQVELFGFRADFFFREAGVVFEIHGFGPHGQVRRHFVRDRRKTRTFAENGLIVVEAAADELHGNRDEIKRQLTQAVVTGLLQSSHPPNSHPQDSRQAA